MTESEIRAIETLNDMPILDEDDPSAKSITSESAALNVAEAEDTMRLHELLHRDEYRPLAAVRYRRAEGDSICVYFSRLDDTG